jgi:hypothetical protein
MEATRNAYIILLRKAFGKSNLKIKDRGMRVIERWIVTWILMNAFSVGMKLLF